MDAFYLFLLVIILVFFSIILLSISKNKKANEIIETFSDRKLNKIEVGLSETSYSNFSQYGGVSSKSILYYDKDLLIFTPSENSLFNGLLNTLPLILVLKIESNLPKKYTYKIIQNIIIKSDQYILTFSESTLTTKKKKELCVYSDRENIKLKEIISSFAEYKNSKSANTRL